MAEEVQFPDTPMAVFSLHVTVASAESHLLIVAQCERCLKRLRRRSLEVAVDPCSEEDDQASNARFANA
jgi:hypothetical protein